MSERVPRPSLRAVPVTDLRMGMIPPAMPFVRSDGTLETVGFRFLFMLWNSASENRARIEAIEARLAAAGIP